MENLEIIRIIYITTLSIFLSPLVSPIIKELAYRTKGSKRFVIMSLLILAIMIYLFILLTFIETFIL